MITRTIQGIAFEFDTPSVFRPKGLPVEISYTESGRWSIELLWKDQISRGEYPSRDAAIAVIVQALHPIRLIKARQIVDFD